MSQDTESVPLEISLVLIHVGLVALTFRRLDSEMAIRVELLIDREGCVSSTEYLAGPEHLEESFTAAYASFVYHPATIDGKPVAFKTIMSYKMSTTFEAVPGRR